MFPIVHSRTARAAVVVVSASLLGACFDWATRVSPSPDASDPRDGAVGEEDRSVPDAIADDTGTPIEGGPSCADLVADIVESRAKARRCTLGVGHCATKVKDECDCEHFVAIADSPETMAFEAKIAVARAAGCRDHCASCAFVPNQGTCLSQAGSNSCSP